MESEHEGVAHPGISVNRGDTLQRIQTQYSTAINVQRPRNIDMVVKSLDRECEYGADTFFYSMVFKTKKGPVVVEGPSVGLAYAIARTWGNCAVEMPPSAIAETDTHYTVTASFVDLENGVTIARSFRKAKPTGYVGQKPDDLERKQDIAFQVAQSKASRNVICSAIPKWLVDRCVKLSKTAVEKGINAEGVVNASQKAVKIFASLGVSEEQLCAKVGRPVSQWTSSDVATLRGDYTAIKGGEVSVHEMFEQATTSAAAGTGPVSVDSLINPAGSGAAEEPEKRKRGRPRKDAQPGDPSAAEVQPELKPEDPQAGQDAAAVGAATTEKPKQYDEAALRARFKAALDTLLPDVPNARTMAFEAAGITQAMVDGKNIPAALVEAAVQYLETTVKSRSK